MMSILDIKIIVASDVNKRDGIGIEVYHNENLILEIFRDDTEKSRTVTTYNDSIPLEVMEYSIEQFKKEIPNEFIKYPDQS